MTQTLQTVRKRHDGFQRGGRIETVDVNEALPKRLTG